MDRHIYVMISCTPTRFGGLIRKVAHLEYNHTSIILDDEFNEIYAFARKQHNAVLSACLVKETVSRYTLNKDITVHVAVFRFDITEEQYQFIKDTIDRIYNNNDYIYNLFSVLSYPVTKGFPLHNAFSCVEFVAYLLREVGYPVDKPLHSLRPDDMLHMFSQHMCYEGNLLDFKADNGADYGYFEPFSWKVFKESVYFLGKTFYRMVTLRFRTY